MSATLSPRLRDIYQEMRRHSDTIPGWDTNLFFEAIAQAEREAKDASDAEIIAHVFPEREAQAGELSDEEIERIAMEWSFSRCRDKHTERLDLAEDAVRVLRYARDHGYLRPSQAIGEPVALDDRTFIALFAKVKCEFCEEGKDEGRTCATCHGLGMRDPDLYELRSRMRNLYRSPISPEARDRAIEALDLSKEALPYAYDDRNGNTVTPWNLEVTRAIKKVDQAISALRGQTPGA